MRYRVGEFVVLNAVSPNTMAWRVGLRPGALCEVRAVSGGRYRLWFPVLRRFGEAPETYLQSLPSIEPGRWEECAWQPRGWKVAR